MTNLLNKHITNLVSKLFDPSTHLPHPVDPRFHYFIPQPTSVPVLIFELSILLPHRNNNQCAYGKQPEPQPMFPSQSTSLISVLQIHPSSSPTTTISSGPNETVYFPHTKKQRRLKNFHSVIEELLYSQVENDKQVGYLTDRKKPIIFPVINLIFYMSSHEPLESSKPASNFFMCTFLLAGAHPRPTVKIKVTQLLPASMPSSPVTRAKPSIPTAIVSASASVVFH